MRTSILRGRSSACSAGANLRRQRSTSAGATALALGRGRTVIPPCVGARDDGPELQQQRARQKLKCHSRRWRGGVSRRVTAAPRQRIVMKSRSGMRARGRMNLLIRTETMGGTRWRNIRS
ncbi:unnamed protein product, partial [Sphacelaria rigidula]